MTRIRSVGPTATLVSLALFAAIIIPIFILLSSYLKEERILRNLPGEINSLIEETKYEKAHELATKAELELEKIPNNLTPLKAVTQIYILAMSISKTKKIEGEKLTKIKERLNLFKPITNGYKRYRDLVHDGEKLAKLIKQCNGKIFFSKKKKRFLKNKF